MYNYNTKWILCQTSYFQLSLFQFLHPVYDRLARFSAVSPRWKEIIHRTSSLLEHMHFKLGKLTKAENT